MVHEAAGLVHSPLLLAVILFVLVLPPSAVPRLAVGSPSTHPTAEPH